jgi:hypothetical protein
MAYPKYKVFKLVVDGSALMDWRPYFSVLPAASWKSIAPCAATVAFVASCRLWQINKINSTKIARLPL